MLECSVGHPGAHSPAGGFGSAMGGVRTVSALGARGRVLVVGEEGALTLALEVSLRESGYDVRSEPDGTAVETAAEAFLPDLAILDVRFPVGPDGYTIARRLCEADRLPIIFLSRADSIEDRLRGFRAGADDYVVRPFVMPELLARVDAVLRRAGRRALRQLRVDDLVIDTGARVVTRSGRRIHLTPIEYRLLCVLAERPGEVVSKKRLLSLVWNYTSLDPNVVEVHVSSLRRRLERHGSRLVHTERGRGYVVRPCSDDATPADHAHT